ncbi:hypothetical protein NRI_0547 [Neorickettsia risticii str. Illinois]|uniref:Uncharacterized protein n=1 Tax=Neorickettsia risticii (strain Illinois) TaxID=434131 RepID=C6V559_NEORI|nr:hypothetical protein NRI_0547 [Neorickettsia risticii str. Illinois]
MHDGGIIYGLYMTHLSCLSKIVDQLSKKDKLFLIGVQQFFRDALVAILKHSLLE